MIQVFTDLSGLLLTFMPMILVGIIVATITNKRASTKTSVKNPTPPTLKRTSTYCLIDTGLITFFTLAQRLGWDSVNTGFGTWTMWGQVFTMFAAIPLFILFIFDLIRYFKTTDKTTRSKNLPTFALSILSVTLLIATLYITITFLI